MSVDTPKAPPEATRRRIYEFRDDTGERGVDPVEVDWAMELALEGEDRDSLREAAEGDDAGAAIRASAKLLDAVRAAFGVTAYDHATRSGLTISETFDLWLGYQDWCDPSRAVVGGPSPASDAGPGPASPATPAPGLTGIAAVSMSPEASV